MSLEANKIAAAILVGGMLTLSVGLVSNMIYETNEGGGTEAAKPAPVAEKPLVIEPVSGLLAKADVNKGAEISKKCAVCHSFGKGEPAKVGPNLWGIVGNKHAHMEGFPYSDAIKGMADKTWSYEEINHFITNPKHYAPGTKMTFPGLPKVQDRADLIAWLRTQADTPVPLPSDADIKAAEDAAKQQQAAAAQAAPAPAAAQPEAAAPAAAAPEEDATKMIASADPKKGEQVASKCKACHDFTKGGPNKIGPNLWGVIGGPTAHKQDFNYSDAIKGLNSTWTFANLDKFLTSPRKYAPGTKMTFPGLPKAADRAAVMRWLRDQSDNPVPLPQ
jgi:cytochrome c